MSNRKATIEQLETKTIPITGMTCASCEQRITKSLTRLPGVTSVTASAVKGQAVIEGDRIPSDEEISRVLAKHGYSLGAPPLLSKDPAIWRTVTLSAIIVVLLGWVALTLGFTDLPSKLTAPSGGGLMLVLVLGLTAGVSTCMAMVGGLVLAVSASHAVTENADTTKFMHRMRPHLAFNFGRILGFFLLGTLLGLLGSSLSLPPAMMGLLTLGVGLVMLLLGVRLTGASPRMAAWTPKLPAGLSRLLGVNPDQEGESSYSDVRAGMLGAATFFMPCGFTQAVQLYALSTASALTGGLVMAVFALGTTPGLLSLAAVPEVAKGDRRVKVLRVVGVVVIGFAMLNMFGGMRVLGYFTAAPAQAYAATQTAALSVSSNVKVANGVQTVTMTQLPNGYEPANTVVYAGMPINWVVTGTAPYSCSMALRSADMGVQTNLNEGENIIKVNALQPGNASFACVMGMYSGNFTVVEKPVAPAPATSQGSKS